MSTRKINTIKVTDATPTDHLGRLGEITYRNGFLYYHDGVTPGGELINGGGSGGGGPTSWSSVTGKPSFAAVATSGSYADLTSKPSIPSKVSDLTNDSGFITSVAWTAVTGKPTLFSGAYADLTGKPTLFSGAYADLTGKPTLFSGAYADLTGKPTLFTANQTLNTGDSVSFNRLAVTGASGIEGGEIQLAKAPTSTLAGDVIIDVYDNKIRFFEGGGNSRGFYLDLTTGANNTSTNIMSGGGGTGAQGEPGAAGAPGADGNDGAAGAQGPQGEPGAAGAPGADGNDGAPGQGVPTGGTVGQVLAKIDGTDYNTEWVNQTGGSGSSSFDTIIVDGSSDVIADGTTTFELVAGTGIAITTGSDNQITISATDSTLLEPYKGFRAHYGTMYNNTDDENGPINKLVIYKSSVTPASAIDTDTSSDDFQVTGLTGSDVVAMLVVVSDNITQTSLADLKTFVEKIIDEVILDEGAEGDVNTVSAMKSAFYDNFNNFNTIIPNVKADLEFFTNNNNQFSISPEFTTGDGATFSGISYNMVNDTLDLGSWGQGTPNTHEVNDVHVIPGNTIQDAAGNFLVTPDNDVTVTITGVSGGAIQTYTVTGTLPRPAEIWPAYSISDGGDDEYDGANAIHTNLATDIGYNSGNVVNGADEFNSAGTATYVVTYQAGIFGIFARGCDIDIIGTSGNNGGYGNDNSSSGFDGDGVAVTGGLYSDSTPDVTVSEITNTSSSGSAYSVSVGTDGVVTMVTSRGGLEFGALPEPGGPSHFHIMRPANENGSGGTDLYFGDDYNYVLQRPAQYGSAPGYGVEIGANDRNGGDQHVWRFGTDGKLQLPAGGTITEGGGLTGAIRLTPAGGANEYQALVIYPTAAGDGDHIHLTAGGGTTDLYLGSDLQYVKIENGGNVVIQAADGENNSLWLFNKNGDLTAPRNIILNNPVTTVTTSVTGTVADSNGNPFTFRILKADNPQLVTPFADPNFVLKWTGTDAGSVAAAAQAPGGQGPSSLVSDDGTYWNFNSWFGLNTSRPNTGTVFTVEYGVVVSDTTISTTDTNLVIEANTEQWKFGTDGVLTLPDNSVIASYKPVTVIAKPTSVQTISDNASATRLTFIESVDSVGAFTDSTFTVPYTGYYQFNATVYFTSDVTLTNGFLVILNTTSGLNELDTLYYGAHSGRVINGSSMQYLTAGDTVALFFRQVSGNDVDIGSSSRLTIHRVSIS